jgi:hypothetical protein
MAPMLTDPPTGRPVGQFPADVSPLKSVCGAGDLADRHQGKAQADGSEDQCGDPNECLPGPGHWAGAINKWAAGVSDTLVLGLLTEAIGKRLPVAALPFINAAQAEHPAFQASIDRLQGAGVQLLYGPDVLELHEPGSGSQRVGLFPWRLTREALERNRASRPFQQTDLDAR